MLLSSSGLYAQKSVDKLIDNIKKHPSSVTMTLPGWLINKAVDAVSNTTDLEEDEEVWLEMAHDIKKVRFSVVEDDAGLLDIKKLNEFIDLAKSKDGFEEYARVKSDGNHVHILVRNEKETIKNILIYAFGEEGVVAVHLKTKFSLESFKKADFSFNKNKS